MIYDEKAFINFDAIQAINKSQYIEVKEINDIFNKKIKIDFLQNSLNIKIKIQ